MRDRAKHAKFWYYVRWIPAKLGIIKFSPYDVKGLMLWWKADEMVEQETLLWGQKGLSKEQEVEVRDYLAKKYEVEMDG